MAYDTYQAHEWQHGEVITSQRLNTLEQAVENGSTVTKYLNELQYNEITEEEVNEGESYDPAHGTENNKIETAKSVDRKILAAINALDVEKLSIDGNSSSIDNSNPPTNETGYQRVLTTITQTNGKITDLEYKVLPIATKFGANDDVNGGTLGLVRVGNDLTITPQGGLSGDYKIDNLWNIDDSNKPSTSQIAYNNVEKTALNEDNPAYNPLTTVKSVDYRVKRLIGQAITLPEVAIDQTNDNYAGTRLTITGFIPNTGTGTIQFNREAISIPIEQVNDIHITGDKNANGQDNEGKYTIPTLATVTGAISLGNVVNDPSASSLAITSITATNSDVTLNRAPISITRSQVSDLVPLRSLTENEILARDTAIAGNNEWDDPRGAGNILGIEDYDTIISHLDALYNKIDLLEIMGPDTSEPNEEDTRPAGGLITPTDKDNLDALFAKNDLLITMTSAPVSGTDEREDAGLISKTDKDALDTLYAKNNYLVAMDSKPIGTDTRLTSGLFKKDDKDALDTLLKNITIDSSGNIVGIKIYNAEGTAYKTLTYSGLVEPEPEPEPQPGE